MTEHTGQTPRDRAAARTRELYERMAATGDTRARVLAIIRNSPGFAGYAGEITRELGDAGLLADPAERDALSAECARLREMHLADNEKFERMCARIGDLNAQLSRAATREVQATEELDRLRAANVELKRLNRSWVKIADDRMTAYNEQFDTSVGLRAALKHVQELHRRSPDSTAEEPVCAEDGFEWPCVTRANLDAALLDEAGQNPCTACGGTGEWRHGGSANPDSSEHYPPTVDPCNDCRGTGDTPPETPPAPDEYVIEDGSREMRPVAAEDSAPTPAPAPKPGDEVRVTGKKTGRSIESTVTSSGAYRGDLLVRLGKADFEVTRPAEADRPGGE